jgi:NADH-quinone oxidoreductase subunit C
VTAEHARERLAALPGVTVEAGLSPVVARVPLDQWPAAARLAKDTLGCAYFCFATVIDWKADGLEVVAWVDNLAAPLSLQLRTRLGPGNSVCPSLVPIYRGADWMEREGFDMFGVRFDGHPDLRRILLADDWEGHPLLKSYAVDTPFPPYR